MVAEVPKDEAEIVERAEAGHDLCRSRQKRQRRIGPANLQRDHAEQVQRFRIVRILVKDLAIDRVRLLKLAGCAFILLE